MYKAAKKSLSGEVNAQHVTISDLQSSLETCKGMVQELERKVGSLMQSQTDLAPDLGALLEQIAVLLQQLEQGHAAHACMAAAFQQEGHNQAEAVSSVAADQLQQQASRIAELHQRNLALEHERSGLEAQKQQVESALAQALEVNKKHAYAYAASEQSKSQRASLAEAKHAAGMHAAALAACQEAAERASQQHAASLAAAAAASEAAAKHAAVAHAATLTAYKEVADQAGRQNAADLLAAEVTAKQVAEEHAVSLVCHDEALSKAEQSHAAAIAGEKADLQAQLQALRASHSIELQSLHAELKCAMESSKAGWVARKADLPTQLKAEHARQQAVGDAGILKLQAVQAQLEAKQESRSHLAQQLADQSTALVEAQAKLQPVEAQPIYSHAGVTAIPAGLTALAAHFAQQSPPPAAPPKDIGIHVSHTAAEGAGLQAAADGQESNQQQLSQQQAAARQLIEQLQQQQQMLPTVQWHAQGPGIDLQPAAACQQGTPEHDGAGQDSAGEGCAQGITAQGSSVQANGHLPAVVLHQEEGMQESGTGVLSSAHWPYLSALRTAHKLMSSIVVVIRTTRQYCMVSGSSDFGWGQLLNRALSRTWTSMAEITQP